MRAIAAGATAAVLENKKLKAENQKLSNTNKIIGMDLSAIKKENNKIKVAASYVEHFRGKAEARIAAN